jgi:PAS domain S-box-containing protein
MGADKKAAAHNSETEARLRAVLDTAVEGIVIIDAHGIVQLFNKSAEKIFGYRADEALGRNINFLMPSPYAENHDHYLAHYLKTGKAHIIGIGREVRGLRKDGVTFPLALAVSEIGSGMDRQFVGLVRDISQRKQLEEALVMASENERMIIGQELHDTLSQQLAAIAMMTRALEKQLGSADAAAREAAAGVAETARDACNVAKRLAHGLFPTELERYGLAAALEELADNQNTLFKKECRYSGIRNRLGLSRPVDRNLYRIAQEAVSNAVKHSGAKHIDIKLDVSPTELLLTVHDDGCGLPQHQQPGKGMGLAIMKYRAGMINATLTISSALRSGTVVTCRLPDWQKAVQQRKLE